MDIPRSSVVETVMGVLPMYAPPPFRAENISPEHGLYTAPHTMLLSSLEKSPTETQKCGIPWAKLFVPSMGSIYQTYSPGASCRLPSSAIMVWDGYLSCMVEKMKSSDSLSTLVTRLVLLLYSMLVASFLKPPMIRLPASAVTSMVNCNTVSMFINQYCPPTPICKAIS